MSSQIAWTFEIASRCSRPPSVEASRRPVLSASMRRGGLEVAAIGIWVNEKRIIFGLVGETRVWTSVGSIVCANIADRRTGNIRGSLSLLYAFGKPTVREGEDGDGGTGDAFGGLLLHGRRPGKTSCAEIFY